MRSHHPGERLDGASPRAFSRAERRGGEPEQRRERGGGGVRGGRESVSPLERRRAPSVRESKQPFRHQRVSLIGHAHPPQRIALRGVESCGDDDEIRVETFGDGIDDEVKRGEVIGVAQALLLPRDVHVEPLPSARADLGRRPRPGIKSVAVAMQRDVQHPRVFVEDVLNAVAVVHVPIQDEHPPRGASLERDARGDRGVVEETETGGAAAIGVVSRRSDDGERAIARPRRHGQCSLARRPRRRSRASLGVSGPVDVSLALHALVGRRIERRANRRQVCLRVTRQQFRVRRLARRHAFAPRLQTRLSELFHDGGVSRGTLEMMRGTRVELHHVRVQETDSRGSRLAHRARTRLATRRGRHQRLGLEFSRERSRRRRVLLGFHRSQFFSPRVSERCERRRRRGAHVATRTGFTRGTRVWAVRLDRLHAMAGVERGRRRFSPGVPSRRRGRGRSRRRRRRGKRRAPRPLACVPRGIRARIRLGGGGGSDVLALVSHDELGASFRGGARAGRVRGGGEGRRGRLGEESGENAVGGKRRRVVGRRRESRRTPGGRRGGREAVWSGRFERDALERKCEVVDGRPRSGSHPGPGIVRLLVRTPMAEKVHRDQAGPPKCASRCAPGDAEGHSKATTLSRKNRN